MCANVSKPLIFVVISFLVVALIYESYPGFEAFAAPRDPNWRSDPSNTCECVDTNCNQVSCCWAEDDILNPGEYIVWCQTCDYNGKNCGPVELKRSSTSPLAPLEDGVLEQPPTPPPFDPTAPLQGGVLEQQEPTFAPGTSPGILEQLEQGEGLQQGFFEQQQQQPPTDQGAAQLPPPATEESQPATVEDEQPAPVCQEGLEFNEDLGFCVPTECPEGQVLNEESGICVLEEQPAAAEDEPEGQQQQTEEEQPSEESGSEDGNN